MDHGAAPRCASGGLAVSGAVALAGVAPALAADAPPLAYVTNQKGDVSVLDLSTLKITGSVSASGKEPRAIGMTTDGQLLVVANREGGRIAPSTWRTRRCPGASGPGRSCRGASTPCVERSLRAKSQDDGARSLGGRRFESS